MQELWSYFKNLFNQAESSSPSEPLIHEMIERSEAEREDYDQWKNQLVCRRLQDWLNNQYAIYCVAPDDIDEALDFLDTPSSKGFVVHFFKTRYSERDIQHFFDYLKEQVLALNYRTQISDLRTYQRPDWVETVQRHYLKPRPPFMRKDVELKASGLPLERFDQRFGNVMIEMDMRNERPHYLKFRATSYKDHLFTEAEEFRDLMQAILV